MSTHTLPVPRTDVRAELAEAVRTGTSRGLVVAAAVLGLLSGVVGAFTGPADDHTFAQISTYVHSAISLPLPFVSLLLVTRDFARPASGQRSQAAQRGVDVVGKLLASVVIALAGGAFGVVVAALATALSPAPPASGRWHSAALLVLGGLLVQVIAQLVGAGFGLLIRSSLAAAIADVALPLGIWAVLSSSAGTRPIAGWLTPYGNAQHLLSGRMGALEWAQLAVVIGVWVVLLNLAGLVRLRRWPPQQ